MLTTPRQKWDSVLRASQPREMSPLDPLDPVSLPCSVYTEKPSFNLSRGILTGKRIAPWN